MSAVTVAKHAGVILKLLSLYIRGRFPDTRIVFRADRGFCHHRTRGWCERHGIDYIVGLARNPRLQRYGQSLQTQAAEAFEAQGCKKALWRTPLRGR